MTVRGGESGAALGALASVHDKKVMRSSSSSSRRSPGIYIDDLPDVLVVEILCRLPREVVQCKCVSKYWFTLISNRCFLPRFLHLQTPSLLFHADHRSIIRRKNEPKPKPKWGIFTMFSEPHPGPFKTLVRRFSLLSLLPLDEEPVVLATYNDLLLCCTTRIYQRDYYICNPYTKQWVALPPPRQCHQFVTVGFICDEPYHKYMRCKVVRIPTLGNKSLHFEMEIFSSETGEWRELVVSTPQGLKFNFNRAREVGVACNGMLYWPDNRGRLLRLDPSINNVNTTGISTRIGDHIIDHKYFCCFVNNPVDGCGIVGLLHVFQGCLRTCQQILGRPNWPCHTLCVWELREEEEEQIDGGVLKLKWCLIHSVRVDQLASENLFFAQRVAKDKWSRVVGLDPESEGVIYLSVDGDIVVWNICTHTSSIIYQRKSPDSDVYGLHTIYAFPFVLPFSPTPVPRVLA